MKLLGINLLIVGNDRNIFGLYVNGSLHTVCNGQTHKHKILSKVLTKNPVYIPNFDYVYIKDLYQFPNKQNDLISIYKQVPIYLPPDIGLDMKERPHVRWFVWFNSSGKVVVVGDRNNYDNTPFDEVEEKIKEVGLVNGGVRCTMYNENKYPNISSLHGKLKFEETYVVL